MNKQAIIRSILSGLLICIFAFSITPKKTLHDFVVKHKDSASRNPDGKTHLTTWGYNCKCDDLVTESTFINNCSYPVILMPELYYDIPGCRYFSFFSIHHFYSELRGPPVSFNSFC